MGSFSIATLNNQRLKDLEDLEVDLQDLWNSKTRLSPLSMIAPTLW